MAILGDPKSQVEVRILKLTHDPANLRYFDEYAPLADRETPKQTVVRYIVPEEITYAIEVTVKRGFHHGKYDGGYGVQIRDAASRRILLWKELESKPGPVPLEADKVYQIDAIQNALVDGQVRQNVQFSFHKLSPDEDLSGTTDVPGYEPEDLGGIEVQFARYSKLTIGISRPEHKLKEEMEVFRDQIANQRTLKAAEKIGDTLFNKSGITHEMRLTGGIPGGTIREPLRSGSRAEHIERRIFSFNCRTAEYLELKQIVKTPIPLECRPWNSLKESERKSCFKTLQDYDKEHTFQQRISEAGSDVDTKALWKQVFEVEDVPSRWRGWNSLLKREREGLFDNLQLRHRFFDKGEYPPDERLPGNSRKTALSL